MGDGRHRPQCQRWFPGRGRLRPAGFAARLVAAFLIGFIATGCSRGEPPASEQKRPEEEIRQGDTVVIEMYDIRFRPADVVVTAGTKIVFVNRDRTPHNVVQGTPDEATAPEHTPLFQSPLLQPSERWSIVFDTPGRYPYVCTFANHHRLGMAGTITVQPSSGDR